jgi:hypothetical protein
MAACVMHCLAVKLCAPVHWTLAARGHRPAITLAKVEAMIDMSVETLRPVEPGPRSEKYAA